MSIRVLSLSFVLLAGFAGAVRAQDGFFNSQNPTPNGTEPNAAEQNQILSPQEENQDEEEKPPVYEYPQRHMFEQPVTVGSDHLRSYTGYWQPGGYNRRDGSPFFNSVPGAPPRGPIAGGGGDSSNNAAAGGAMSPGGYADPNGMMAQNGYMGQGYGYGMPGYGPGMMVPPGYAMQGMMGMMGYGMQGMQGGGNTGGGGGAGGAGGDPYNYHFGPGYYRSSEYGHFRFPYYSYRRPWFHPGFAGFNRDVNIPW
ncbi:MAG: hypothetical protein KDA76_02750 [Planctomycetaceae bacterium]|nr:hypothetical protein [Planctomycetaceae bacterium]